MVQAAQEVTSEDGLFAFVNVNILLKTRPKKKNISCGEEVKQRVNGVIKYIPLDSKSLTEEDYG